MTKMNEPTTLLKYSIMTEPFPLQASPEKGTAKTASVTIVASNPSPDNPVTLKSISIILPIGSGATDLSAVATRKDGNTVQLESELLKLNQNFLEHQLETQLVSGNMLKLRLAITGRPA